MCYNGVSREGAILKVCVLASGSSGNSTLVSTARTKLLVDAGLSRRETCARLASIGEDPAKIGAILISHRAQRPRRPACRSWPNSYAFRLPHAPHRAQHRLERL